MTERNEGLPRQSDLTRFIDEEEFKMIPRDILQAKAAEGIRKHKLIEDEYYEPSNNIIVQMFIRGLVQVCPGDETQNDPIFEKQINGSRFTGKPDFILADSLIDYKFTDILRPKVALQLVLYMMLARESGRAMIDIARLYAFHYLNDYSLFVHKVPELSVQPLMGFAYYIIENHEAISAGELERYIALARWEKLLIDYDVFEPVAQVFAPLTITNRDKALNAVMVYHKLKEVENYGEKVKSELVRYMQENGDTRLGEIGGCCVRLDKKTTKIYDKAKKAEAKKVYDKALKDCLIGKEEDVKLVRYKEPKVLKQLN